MFTDPFDNRSRPLLDWTARDRQNLEFLEAFERGLTKDEAREVRQTAYNGLYRTTYSGYFQINGLLAWDDTRTLRVLSDAGHRALTANRQRRALWAVAQAVCHAPLATHDHRACLSGEAGRLAS